MRIVDRAAAGYISSRILRHAIHPPVARVSFPSIPPPGSNRHRIAESGMPSAYGHAIRTPSSWAPETGVVADTYGCQSSLPEPPTRPRFV
ncbi:MAG: hypothetical protein KAS74_05780 [Methanosarcinales archaeon]|nr:hypothetical protein [Methanosarcinales archaeon]